MKLDQFAEEMARYHRNLITDEAKRDDMLWIEKQEPQLRQMILRKLKGTNYGDDGAGSVRKTDARKRSGSGNHAGKFAASEEG